MIRPLLICGTATLFSACSSTSAEPSGDATASDVLADTTADATVGTEVSDMGDTSSTPKTAHAGEPCDAVGLGGWCDENAVVVLDCVGSPDGGRVWATHVDYPGSIICFCDPATSPGPITNCAIPGFVGIDRAGRHRQGPSLRAINRASRFV